MDAGLNPHSPPQKKHIGRWPLGIKAYLILLVAVSILPMIGISSVLIWRQSSIQQNAIDQALSAGAHVLAVGIDSELDGYVRMLSSLAESESLLRGDLRGFYDATIRAAQRNKVLFVSMFDRELRQVINTRFPIGGALPQPVAKPVPSTAGSPPVGDIESIKGVFTTGKARYSDLFNSLSMNRLIFTANVPVFKDGAIMYVLNVGLDPNLIAELLVRDQRFLGTPTAVVDGNGFVIARSRDGIKRAGKKSTMSELIKTSREGITKGATSEGIKIYAAYEKSQATGWTAMMAVDPSRFGNVQRERLFGAGLVTAGLFLALFLAFSLAKRIRSSANQLLTVVSGDDAASIRPAHIAEFASIQNSLASLVAARKGQEEERHRRQIAEVQKEQAESENRQKDLYLATLAHELRNPLAPIKNAVALLRLKELPDPQQRWGIDVIDRQVGQMARLMDDLLELSRIASGKIELRLSAVELTEVVREAIETVKPLIEPQKQDLSLNVPDHPVWILGDKVRISQIVANLLNNASKYTNRGGKISVSVKLDNEGAIVSVKDNGVGITQDMLDKVFEPFFQARSAKHRAEGGLGIGLALVKGLISLHGGSVVAKSDGLGKGSEFVVSLPLDRRNVVVEQEKDVPSLSQVNKTILIVDDNKDAADTLAALLREAGAAVGVCYKAQGAIDMTGELHPDIAILDIGMPGMDGYELARRISRMPQRPYLIALTGWGQKSDQQKALKAGFDQHLTKPIKPSELFKILHAIQ